MNGLAIMNNDFNFTYIEPEKQFSDFVESIGIFFNSSTTPKEVVVLPDGRIDLFFWKSDEETFEIILLGLETVAEQRSLPPKTIIYVISFKPLAVEYLLRESIAELLNTGKKLPYGFWSFGINDLNDFDTFCLKANQQLAIHLPAKIDERKRKLFELIYASNGEMTVKALSENVFWSSRQINRYFTQQFGLPLKAYCSILRFRASLNHIAKGKLFPELNFTDQTYFIKEIRKFSGVVPRELSQNKNDRFVLLSVLKQK